MKRIISLLLSAVMILSGTVFAVPVFETVESAEPIAVTEETAEEEVTLASTDKITVSFAGDIATEFASVEMNAGDTLDLSDYLNVELSAAAKAKHMRFNGWMPDGDETKLTTDTVTVADDDGDGKMELVALVNHDFNFALEANRAYWYTTSGRAELSVGESGNTIYVTAKSSIPSMRVADGTNGADFKIDTGIYKGATVYYGYTFNKGSSNLTSLYYTYGLGVSNAGPKSWNSEPNFCIPRQASGYGDKTGGFYKQAFHKIYDENGNDLYAGVDITVDTSSDTLGNNHLTLKDEWTGTINSIAVPLIYAQNDYEVRYIRFVPYEGETVTVNFTGDIATPFSVEAKKGKTIDLSNYLDVELSDAAKAKHMRFNGWMPDGEETELATSTITVTDDDGDGKMELVALVNHDFNFAVPANRAYWYPTSGRAELSVGESGNTIYVTAKSSIPSMRVADGTNGADFKIDTTVYKGATVYYGYTFNKGSSNLTSLYYTYGLGVSNAGPKSWDSEPNFCIPRQASGYGDKTGGFYNQAFHKIYDESGNDLYAGVDITVDTSSDTLGNNHLTLKDEWTGTINSIAVPLIYAQNDYEVRYIRFVAYPKTAIDANITLAAPVAGETAQTTVSGTGYTGTVTWSPALTDGKFAYETAYTATVDLTLENLYTADEVVANGYVVTGATVTNTAGSTTFTAAFAATEAKVTKPGINLWTGTTAAFTFDDSSKVSVNNGSVTVDPTNEANNIASLNAWGTLTSTKTAYGIEGDRPVEVKFDFYATGGSFYLYVNGDTGTSTNRYATFAYNPKNQWYTKTFEVIAANSTSAGWAGGDVLDSVNLRNWGDAGTTYIDNVSVTPYYKVTYDANGGTGTVTPAYFLANTFTAFNDGSTLSYAGKKFAGWSLTAGGEAVTSVTPTPGSDITLYAVWEDASIPVKPGINIWTDTTGAYTFDDASGITTGGSIVADPTDGTNNVLSLAAWKTLTSANTAWGLDGNRPVELKFDFYATGGTFYLYVNGDSGGESTNRYATFAYNPKNQWYTKTFEITASKASDGWAGADVLNSVNLRNWGDAGTTYFDNVSVTPYYKVTYDVNGGTGSVDSVYFLADTFTALNDGAALSNGTKKFMGWSLTETGDVVTSVTPTPGSDITLYAIWADITNIDVNVSLTAPVAGATAATTVSGTGYTGTVTWSPALTDGKFAYSTAYTATVALTLDALYTADAVAENGYVVSGATVTNAAGATTFTAVFPATEKEPVKPGINLWTGTTAAFTFDDASKVSVNNGSVAVDPTNEANNIASLNAWGTVTSTNAAYGIEGDRPVEVKFDFYAIGGSFYLYVNGDSGSSSTNRYATFAYNPKNQWYTKTFEVIAANSTSAGWAGGDVLDSVNLRNWGDAGTTYFDNVSVTPYYKVTYDVNGGSGSVAPVYFLADTFTALNDGSTLTNGTKRFLGWSLTETGDVVTSVTAVPGEDITLYAVWFDIENAATVDYKFNSETAGVADGVITLVAPDAAYTSANIYLADDNGVLAGYTEFAKVTLNDRLGVYTVTGNRAFAAGATKLHVVFSGDGVEDTTEVYEISASHRMAVETPLYTYFVVSDMHLGGSATNIDYFYRQWQNTDPIRTRALGGGSQNRTGDVFSNDVDFVIMNGDLVNYGGYIHSTDGDVGEARYWDILDRYIDERLNIHNIPVFLTNGNHEFYDESNQFGAFHADRLINSITNQVDYIEENYGDDVVITRDSANPDALYYAVDMYGAKYIFMSTPEMSEDKTTASYSVSTKQLKFVEDQLYDGEVSNKTTYIITHMPLSGLTNSAEVEAVIAKHPNTIVFNSHTHYNLVRDTHYTVVGDMVNSFTTSDTGATSYLAAEVSGGDRVTSYNAGQYVEVYADKVVIKGRKFADESKFFGHALYVVDVPGSESTVHKTAISGNIANGATLTALVNGEVPADNAGYTYEWIIAGETVGTGKTYTLSLDSSNYGEYVRLRVTDANGNYSSCNSETVIADVRTLDVASIRTSEPQGLRYAGYVAKSMRDLGIVEEYGYIVAAAEFFDGNDYSALEFNANGDKKGVLDAVSANYASAAAYTKGGRDYAPDVLTLEDAKNVFADAGESVLSGITEDGYYFTAVITGISAEHYKKDIVGRTYIKINGTYLYGETVVRNIYDMAVEYEAKYKAEEKDVPEYITAVLTAGEASGN